MNQFAAVSLLLWGTCVNQTLWAQGFERVADRLANVDAQGVLRWQDSQDEVALLGVNYYTPFWHNFPDLKSLGADHKQVIEQDVQHFARLGLDVLRLHVFDREISDRAGNLLDNEHLDLLDYLIAQARRRGIYTVLTPIAWWGVPGDSPGFSTHFTMHQMTTDMQSRAPQINYLRQFVAHVNRYTGLSYRDDPAVICMELINEPHYPADTTDAQVVDYVNSLADAVRDAGWQKPIFYNGWENHLAAVQEARVDGASFVWYPSGLVAGHSVKRNFLPAVDRYGGSDMWNPSMRDAKLAQKAKIVYEFDAADIPGSYIYPAMARAFREGGAQIATQFQYDPLPLAPFNQGWQTHYLNLVCAPQKAISFMIAAEAFRRLPRLQSYGQYPDSRQFGPFRVSYEEDLSEMVTGREFFHSNSTSTRPASPDTLERIAGCGSSCLVSYEGTGAYFLEKLTDGVWRLEVYPDAVWVNDPYGPHDLKRDVSRVLWRTWPMEIRVADLGAAFSLTAINDGNDFQPPVDHGSFTIRPGVYLLQRDGVSLENWREAKLGSSIGLTEFFALPEAPSPPIAWHQPPQRWVAGKAMSLEFALAAVDRPDRVQLRVGSDDAAPTRTLPLQRRQSYNYLATIPAEWLSPGIMTYSLETSVGDVVASFPPPLPGSSESARWSVEVVSPADPAVMFQAGCSRVKPWTDLPLSQRLVPGLSHGRPALQISVPQFGPPPSAIAFRYELDTELDPWRELLAQRTTLCVRARALEKATTAIEVVLLERDNAAWGTNVPLSTQWSDIRVPLASLRYFDHWAGTPPTRGHKGDQLRPEQLAAVSVCFGAWLFPDHADQPHGIEIESVSIE